MEIPKLKDCIIALTLCSTPVSASDKNILPDAQERAFAEVIETVAPQIEGVMNMSEDTRNITSDLIDMIDSGVIEASSSEKEVHQSAAERLEAMSIDEILKLGVTSLFESTAEVKEDYAKRSYKSILTKDGDEIIMRDTNGDGTFGEGDQMYVSNIMSEEGRWSTPYVINFNPNDAVRTNLIDIKTMTTDGSSDQLLFRFVLSRGRSETLKDINAQSNIIFRAAIDAACNAMDVDSSSRIRWKLKYGYTAEKLLKINGKVMTREDLLNQD